MADNVLEIGDFKLYRESRYGHLDSAQGCKHTSLQMEHGEVVRCKDCGVQVSTWFALRSLAAQWQECINKVQRERAEAELIVRAGLRFKRAKQINATWSRGMAIACPHCKRGILPEDGFGAGSAWHRDIELRNRQVAASKKTEEVK